MGLERLRSHFPRETWMCVHSALRAADYGGALRAPFQHFRPTAGRYTANELTSVCHKSLSFPLGYSPTRSTEAPDQILATTCVATRETHSASTRRRVRVYALAANTARFCCCERRRTIDGSRGATADDSAGARAGHCAARHGVRLVLHRRGPGPRGGARWLHLQVH